MEPLRISGKNLGQLALSAEFCPRCFWLRLHSGFKLPFQIFPGIFSSIDAHTKRVTAAHFAKLERLPNWFSELGEFDAIVPVPHHSRFRWEDPATGILLTGAPDELLRRKDGSLVVLDYKTAKHTENQDSLLPLYEVQLNSYGYIAERIGLGKATALALVYYEPVTDVDADSIDSVARDDGFIMRFIAKVVPVELEPNSIPPLLARTRAIYDLPSAPTGRAGCKDCRRLNGLVEMLKRPAQERLREIDIELSTVAFHAGLLAEQERALRRERIELEGRLAK